MAFTFPCCLANFDDDLIYDGGGYESVDDMLMRVMVMMMILHCFGDWMRIYEHDGVNSGYDASACFSSSRNAACSVEVLYVSLFTCIIAAGWW